eukprot:COSAG01_NODE_4409_length_5056_cov_1.452895_5_plen_369_part_00
MSKKKIKFAEYIWLDGTAPTALLRSKSRVVELNDTVSLSNFPDWGFDGSSTNQAAGDNSDCVLKPVSFVPDPTREDGNYLVMCEVFNKDGSPHVSNTRAVLRQVLEAGAAEQDAYFGFEQEYTLFNEKSQPLGWPEGGYPKPQGPYYCGVGFNRVCGRALIEAHQDACNKAGLLLFGVNAEVMLGQWEFQIGYRGFDEDADPLKTCDHLRYATWLLQKLSEEHSIEVSFANKPMHGDWNGAGCHTNFSTKDMRDKAKGSSAIEGILKRLETKHKEHIALYGHELGARLTGAHETCSIDQFRAGASDRGASIRIPVTTEEKGYGYLEDRRPGANSDAYLVAARILLTVCDLDETKAPQYQKSFAWQQTN